MPVTPLCAFGTDVKSHSPIASGDYSASRLAAIEITNSAYNLGSTKEKFPEITFANSIRREGQFARIKSAVIYL
jgi:hypothetical protein